MHLLVGGKKYVFSYIYIYAHIHTLYMKKLLKFMIRNDQRLVNMNALTSYRHSA